MNSLPQSDPLVNLPGEVWRDIPGYEGLYQVSNMGRVKSFKRNNHDVSIAIKQQKAPVGSGSAYHSNLLRRLE